MSPTVERRELLGSAALFWGAGCVGIDSGSNSDPDEERDDPATNGTAGDGAGDDATGDPDDPTASPTDEEVPERCRIESGVHAGGGEPIDATVDVEREADDDLETVCAEAPAEAAFDALVAGHDGDLERTSWLYPTVGLPDAQPYVALQAILQRDGDPLNCPPPEIAVDDLVAHLPREVSVRLELPDGEGHECAHDLFLRADRGQED